MTGMVHGFKGHPAGHCPIAYYSCHSVLFPGKVPGYGHTQGYRYGSAAVTSGKGVMLRFIRPWEAAYPTVFSDMLKKIPPAGDNLVYVALVTYIPYNFIHG